MHDFENVLWLFDPAMELQAKKGYRVWDRMDRDGLQKDIALGLQYKIVQGACITCIFTVLQNDYFTWGELDRNDAIYLHRIVVHPYFKGQNTWIKY